jgi:hypothetical protein
MQSGLYAPDDKLKGRVARLSSRYAECYSRLTQPVSEFVTKLKLTGRGYGHSGLPARTYRDKLIALIKSYIHARDTSATHCDPVSGLKVRDKDYGSLGKLASAYETYVEQGKVRFATCLGPPARCSTDAVLRCLACV